jgi:hypothetical protein
MIGSVEEMLSHEMWNVMTTMLNISEKATKTQKIGI